jgi:nucleotide-binding universal stress UspA family protein
MSIDMQPSVVGRAINAPSHGIQTIVHPTDFSESSAVAFAHALRIALAMRSLLYLVHVAESKYPEEYDGFPHVRHMLAQWQLMNESDPPAAVGKLGIKVAKIGLKPHDPLRGLLHFLKGHPSDLIVLATHGRDGIAHWLHGSIAAHVAAEIDSCGKSGRGWGRSGVAGGHHCGTAGTDTAQQALIAQLQERIAELERRLGLNSGNSGKPPSSDALKKPVRVSSLRERSGKKTGGQNGHPGETLRRSETPDATIDHFPQTCAVCGEALSGH